MTSDKASGVLNGKSYGASQTRPPVSPPSSCHRQKMRSRSGLTECCLTKSHVKMIDLD